MAGIDDFATSKPQDDAEAAKAQDDTDKDE
jgi:hypothetical protein